MLFDVSTSISEPLQNVVSGSQLDEKTNEAVLEN